MNFFFLFYALSETYNQGNTLHRRETQSTLVTTNQATEFKSKLARGLRSDNCIKCKLVQLGDFHILEVLGKQDQRSQ